MTGSRSESDTLPVLFRDADVRRALLFGWACARRAEGCDCGGGILSGISSPISIESSMSIVSASGSCCVSGIVIGTSSVSGSAARFVPLDFVAGFAFVSFFSAGSFAAALRPLFAGAGAGSSISSSCAFFAGLPLLAGMACATGSGSSKSSTSSVSLALASSTSACALRPPFAATFFAPAAALFFIATAVVPLVRRVAALPLAVALVAAAVFFVCAAVPRVFRAGLSLVDSGVGSALSSSTVISSSEAESTVKEMFAVLLLGAMSVSSVRWVGKRGVLRRLRVRRDGSGSGMDVNTRP